ncbi:MAG: chemotaxis protein CheX [Polyangiaceae bacterium]
MSLEASEVVEVTQMVWTSVLGEEVALDPVTDDFFDAPLFTGCVTVSGAWEGAVTVGCSAELAKQVTAAMFELAPDAASIAEVADAMGEIANMIGGNIKALLPGPSLLSLPAVTQRESGIVVPGSELLLLQSFQYAGQPLRVLVHQRTARARPAAGKERPQ